MDPELVILLLFVGILLSVLGWVLKVARAPKPVYGLFFVLSVLFNAPGLLFAIVFFGEQF